LHPQHTGAHARAIPGNTQRETVVDVTMRCLSDLTSAALFATGVGLLCTAALDWIGFVLFAGTYGTK
jgi:hypothetical protein